MVPGVWGREPPAACGTKCVSGGPGGEAPGKMLRFLNCINRKSLYKNSLLNLKSSSSLREVSDSIEVNTAHVPYGMFLVYVPYTELIAC